MSKGKSREACIEMGLSSRFTAENAAEMAKRSNESQRDKKALGKFIEEKIGNEIAVAGLRKAIERGDIRALELYFRLTGQLKENDSAAKTDIAGEFVQRFLDKFYAEDKASV